MLSARVQEMIALSCGKFIKTTSRIHEREKTPQKKGLLRNWIALNKQQFYSASCASSKKSSSLDEKPRRELQKIKIEFESPSNMILYKNDVKTRCNSTGSSTGSDGGQKSPRKVCKTDRKVRQLSTEMELGIMQENKEKNNLILGLKPICIGFPTKRIDLGSTSFMIRGRKMK